MQVNRDGGDLTWLEIESEMAELLLRPSTGRGRPRLSQNRPAPVLPPRPVSFRKRFPGARSRGTMHLDRVMPRSFRSVLPQTVGTLPSTLEPRSAAAAAAARLQRRRRPTPSLFAATASRAANFTRAPSPRTSCSPPRPILSRLPPPSPAAAPFSATSSASSARPVRANPRRGRSPRTPARRCRARLRRGRERARCHRASVAAHLDEWSIATAATWWTAVAESRGGGGTRVLRGGCPRQLSLRSAERRRVSDAALLLPPLPPVALGRSLTNVGAGARAAMDGAGSPQARAHDGPRPAPHVHKAPRRDVDHLRQPARLRVARRRRARRRLDPRRPRRRAKSIDSHLLRQPAAVV